MTICSNIFYGYQKDLFVQNSNLLIESSTFLRKKKKLPTNFNSKYNHRAPHKHRKMNYWDFALAVFGGILAFLLKMELIKYYAMLESYVASTLPTRQTWHT